MSYILSFCIFSELFNVWKILWCFPSWEREALRKLLLRSSKEEVRYYVHLSMCVLGRKNKTIFSRWTDVELLCQHFLLVSCSTFVGQAFFVKGKQRKSCQSNILVVNLLYLKWSQYVDKCKDLKERKVPFSYMCLIGDGGAGKVGLIQPFYAAQITWRAPHCHMLLDHLINFLSPSPPFFSKSPLKFNEWYRHLKRRTIV